MRKSAGLTQEDAAYAAKIDVKRWQRLESGEVNTSIKTLTRIAKSISASFWDLVARH